MPPKSGQNEVERVWLLAGVALAALFLLRTAGMIFQGAITGLGLFVAIWVLFSWFPALKRLLFSLGGVFDLGVSFGLPYCIAVVMGINGGTMLIATMTCGLLFTFVLATKKLGGPVVAASKSTAVIVRDTMSQFVAWREGYERGKRDQVGTRRSGECDHHGRRGQREEGEEASGRRRRRGVVDLEPHQYEIS